MPAVAAVVATFVLSHNVETLEEFRCMKIEPTEPTRLRGEAGLWQELFLEYHPRCVES